MTTEVLQVLAFVLIAEIVINILSIKHPFLLKYVRIIWSLVPLQQTLDTARSV